MKMYMGADPELVIGKDGKARCAIYRIPEKLDVLETLGEAPAWVYHDGLNMEFGVRPENDINLLVDNIRWGLVRSLAWAEKFGLELMIGDGFKIDLDDVGDKPGWDASGCNPTYNPRYGLEPGPAFPDYAEFMAEVGTLTGCHCHLSSPELVDLAKKGAGEFHDNLARVLAAVIPPMIWRILNEYFGEGSPSIEWMCKRWEKLGVGNYRVPKHGFEYKDVGAAVLENPLFFASVFTVVRDISKLVLSGKKTSMLKMAMEVPIGDSNHRAASPDKLKEMWNFSYEFVCHVRSEITDHDIESIWDCLSRPYEPEEAWCIGKFENKYAGPRSLLCTERT